MKNILCTLLVLTFLCIAFPGSLSSQEAYYSQYYNSPTYYNPAMAGLTQGLNIRISYRDQWPQYTDDLKTYNFSMDVAERFMPGAGGLGIIFNTNKEGKGFIRRNMIGAMGSARIKLGRYWVSQVGFMAAYVQKQIDDTEFIWSDQLDDKHGLLYPQSSFDGFSDDKISYPDLSLGGVVNYEKRYVIGNFGFAMHHVTKPNESFSSLEIKLDRKFVVHTDFVILQVSNPKKGFKFNPGLMYEYMSGFHTFTLGSNIAKSVLYTGIWYRNKQSQIYNYQALILLAGLNIPMVNKYSRLKLMYSYDVSITSMQGTGGAHEITLRFEFDQIHLFKSKSSFADDYPIIFDPLIF
jgi:type IX secretion system PorP/SprF family membrane protein